MFKHCIFAFVKESLIKLQSSNIKARGPIRWVSIISGIVLLISFFLPWVSWSAGDISGYQMPNGTFFNYAEKNFGLGNPFPKLDFVLLIFWLIPVLAVLTIVLAVRQKKNFVPAVIACGLTLSLLTVFYLFTNTLIETGVPASLPGALRLGFYVSALASVLIILSSFPQGRWIKKMGFIILAPVITWVGFWLVSNYLMAQTFDNTTGIKADYTVNAFDLLKEFRANDSLSNAKYSEKIITVNGRVSVTEIVNDSTVNVKMNDSTGSYVIFPFNEPDLVKAKSLKAGDSVSIKGSCSGGVYSDILETEFITFKRCVINK